MANASQTFADTDARIAADIIAALDKHASNPIGWKMPWDSFAGFPVNATTGRSYGGSYNALILMFAAASFGGDMRWAGFGQWRGKKNPVKQGERGVTIFFPRFACAKCNTSAGWAKKCRKCGQEFKKSADKRMVGFSQSTVFNNQQTVEPLPMAEVKDVDPAEGFEAAAAIVAKAGADVRHGGGRAFYSPSGDYIGLPDAGAFATTADYWSTMLHEHAHWTGAEKRLNRVGITRPNGYSREVYAYEELVAEIAASFLCKHAGVDRPGLDDQHIAYLASWRKALTDDPSIIRKAVGEAGKVLRYLTK